ncbi:MAG: hypothetical protein M5U09_25840 [Gammaproteobacteria bacterium]|nr:hypothetical protein [Gammaproteobacteria bacterium]
MGWELPTEGPKTLNGLVLEVFEDVPNTGTAIKVGNMVIEIVKTGASTVEIARLTPLDQALGNGEPGQPPPTVDRRAESKASFAEVPELDRGAGGHRHGLVGVGAHPRNVVVTR